MNKAIVILCLSICSQFAFSQRIDSSLIRIQGVFMRFNSDVNFSLHTRTEYNNRLEDYARIKIEKDYKCLMWLNYNLLAKVEVDSIIKNFKAKIQPTPTFQAILVPVFEYSKSSGRANMKIYFKSIDNEFLELVGQYEKRPVPENDLASGDFIGEMIEGVVDDLFNEERVIDITRQYFNISAYDASEKIKCVSYKITPKAQLLYDKHILEEFRIPTPIKIQIKYYSLGGRRFIHYLQYNNKSPNNKKNIILGDSLSYIIIPRANIFKKKSITYVVENEYGLKDTVIIPDIRTKWFRNPRWYQWGLIGTGVGLLGTSYYTYREFDDLRDEFRVAVNGDRENLFNQAQSYKNVSKTTRWIGAGFLATGIIAYIFDVGKKNAPILPYKRSDKSKVQLLLDANKVGVFIKLNKR